MALTTSQPQNSDPVVTLDVSDPTGSDPSREDPMQDLEFLRDQLIGRLPTGRNFAISAKQLAHELGTSTRVVGKLVEDAIEIDGYVIGSACTTPVAYEVVVDEADLVRSAIQRPERVVR